MINDAMIPSSGRLPHCVLTQGLHFDVLDSGCTWVLFSAVVIMWFVMSQKGCVLGPLTWLFHAILGTCRKHRPSLSWRLSPGVACIGPDMDHVVHSFFLFAEP